MDKDKKRKPYQPINPIIKKRLIQKHGFTARFIYAAIRGERNSESAIRIVEDYNKMTREIAKTLNNL